MHNWNIPSYHFIHHNFAAVVPLKPVPIPREQQTATLERRLYGRGQDDNDGDGESAITDNPFHSMNAGVLERGEHVG
jgi:hypothetical protein